LHNGGRTASKVLAPLIQIFSLPTVGACLPRSAGFVLAGARGLWYQRATAAGPSRRSGGRDLSPRRRGRRRRGCHRACFTN